MKSRTKQALLISLLFAVVANAGCTTIDSLDATPEALAEEKIGVGDKVFLHFNSGSSDEVTISDIGDEAVSGVTENGRKTTAKYADLSSIGHKRVEVLKTAGATVGVIALSPLILVAVLAGGGSY